MNSTAKFKTMRPTFELNDRVQHLSPMPNHSVRRTPYSVLRTLAVAA